jgi:hypothetical protein
VHDEHCTKESEFPLDTRGSDRRFEPCIAPDGLRSGRVWIEHLIEHGGHPAHVGKNPVRFDVALREYQIPNYSGILQSRVVEIAHELSDEPMNSFAPDGEILIPDVVQSVFESWSGRFPGQVCKKLDVLFVSDSIFFNQL